MRLRRPGQPSPYAHLNPAKLRVIDHCFARLGCETFLDLGGIWMVDGGYARYAADVHAARAGTVVDDDFTPAFLQAEAALPNLGHVRGDFGAPAVIDGLGQVDVALFFDVLLHQAAPDWREVLARYAPHTRRFAIVQPQWNGPSTVRLLDLGEEEYFRSIPAVDIVPGSPYDGLFGRLDGVNERRGKPWRDVHDIWQWGIADRDLIDCLAALGFGLALFEDTGPWQGSERFHEGVFVFDRGVATPDRTLPC